LVTPLRYALAMLTPLPAGDQRLVQIIDSALADSVRRSSAWLVCKLGCTQCCVGTFAINQLDALRLQQGLAELEAGDPERAARIRERAHASLALRQADFPGDVGTGLLDETESAEARFEDFANDEPCPVLNPVTGACELYTARPVTCRVFGPPVRSGDGLGICELCYHGASDSEIADCEMEVDPAGVETSLLEELERNTGRHGKTTVAFAVADRR
jgi:Fe-S-cluster containining protein